MILEIKVLEERDSNSYVFRFDLFIKAFNSETNYTALNEYWTSFSLKPNDSDNIHGMRVG